jgi:hypothetical protein
LNKDSRSLAAYVSPNIHKFLDALVLKAIALNDASSPRSDQTDESENPQPNPNVDSDDDMPSIRIANPDIREVQAKVTKFADNARLHREIIYKLDGASVNHEAANKIVNHFESIERQVDDVAHHDIEGDMITIFRDRRLWYQRG